MQSAYCMVIIPVSQHYGLACGDREPRLLGCQNIRRTVFGVKRLCGTDRFVQVEDSSSERGELLRDASSTKVAEPQTGAGHG